jgi:small subunit ribosomal protein S8
MYTDPIADLLTRIRNAQQAQHPTVIVPASRTKERILSVLLDEGYIANVEEETREGNKRYLKVYLRYAHDGTPVIRKLDRLSRAGRRVYVSADDVPVYKSGLGTVVVSTSQGMISGAEARKLNIGGELICSVF